MKLKSKLIATIVSICAAIAVMGVGVWAATSSFTVTVTNQVNIGFSNLTGSATLQAFSSHYEDTSNDLESAAVTVFDHDGTPANQTYELTDESDSTFGSYLTFFGDNTADDVAVSTNVTQQTTAAALAYLVTFTNEDANSIIQVTANAGTAPTPSVNAYDAEDNPNGVKMEASAYIRVGGTGQWTKVENSYVVQPGADKTIEVLFVLEYSNPTLLSTVINGTWQISCAFTAMPTGTAVSAPTPATTIDAAILENGALAIGA